MPLPPVRSRRHRRPEVWLTAVNGQRWFAPEGSDLLRILLAAGATPDAPVEGVTVTPEPVETVIAEPEKAEKAVAVDDAGGPVSPAPTA